MSTTIVHVTGDNGALWAAGSALLGVALGAGATWLQQRTKIGTDEEQLKARLSAEEERLRTQLAYDREMREREALRNVLDDALDAARVEYGWIAISSNENAFGQKPSNNTGAIGLAGSRLVIRLGRGHPVVARYRELREAIEDARWIIWRPLDGEDVVARKLVLKKEIDRSAKALVAFADAAASLVGGPMAIVATPDLDDNADTGAITSAAHLEPVTESKPSTWD
jgi:hypothetical protein